MNREIKFRGKIIDNSGWAYGSLVVEVDKNYIALNINDNIKRDDYDVYMVEVIPRTIGQFTGLYDNTKKEIYERRYSANKI
ncbi:MAG: YopX family protein [Clostridia bacterium]